MIIDHRNGSYPIDFVTADRLFQDLPSKSFLVTDTTVREHLQLPDLPTFSIPAGEESKTPENYLRIIDWLANQTAKRNATIIAVGGGVVGDMAGFAAATYLRGIDFIGIPTTLLAQVDSSVGGKVGVDLKQGKNLLGAFYPPAGVRISLEALNTLPERQLRNGMAEVVKYGFIMRPSILESAKQGVSEALIKSCIECKQEVVEEDELEQSGRRAILNFGHTVGHALEVHTNYTDLLHGEAISIGMVVEAEIAELLGVATTELRHQVCQTLESSGLPVSHPSLENKEALIKAMGHDKKSLGSGLAFSLVTRIGECSLFRDVPTSLVEKALSRCVSPQPSKIAT